MLHSDSFDYACTAACLVGLMMVMAVGAGCKTTKIESSDGRPLPPKPGRPERFDYEYQRNGTRNLFLFFQPLAGWRHVSVTARRTKVDFAHCMQYLVDDVFPEADKVVLVLDNLNTHTPTALYEAFEPAEAKRILDRLEFHYTPKHGSWLNMVEIEIGVLCEQCLADRIPDEETLCCEIAAWELARNEQQASLSDIFLGIVEGGLR